MNQENADQRKKEEWRTFVFFAVVMAPVLSVVVVTGYGLVVWLYQMFAGPPTG
jgi:nitrate reductase NapE